MYGCPSRVRSDHGVKTLMLLGLCLLFVVFVVAAISLASQLETRELRDCGGTFLEIVYMCITAFSTCWKMVAFWRQIMSFI